MLHLGLIFYPFNCVFIDKFSMCPYSIYTRTVLLSIMLLMKILSCWTYISPIILCCFRVWVLRFSSHSYIPYMYRICPMSNSTFTIYNGNNVWRGFVTSSVIILHLFWLSENVWRGFHYLWVFPYYVIRVVLSCSLFSFFLFILYFCKSLLLSNKFSWSDSSLSDVYIVSFSLSILYSICTTFILCLLV